MSASLVEQTYDALMQMILDKQYGPGDRLPSENTLCEELDVSRNTLRAALNKLSALGFTESRQGGGTYLRALETRDFLDLFIPATLTGELDLLQILQFKRGIESEAAAVAAENATEEDVAHLKQCCQECMSVGGAGEVGVLSEENMRFHKAVALATHNILYIRITDIVDMMLDAMAADWKEDGGDIDGSYYHSMVVRNIANHKPDEASFFMQRHMTLIMEYVAGYMKEQNAASEEEQ